MANTDSIEFLAGDEVDFSFPNLPPGPSNEVQVVQQAVVQASGVKKNDVQQHSGTQAAPSHADGQQQFIDANQAVGITLANTLTQVANTMSVIGESHLFLKQTIDNDKATFEQKLAAVESARRMIDSSNHSVHAAAALFSSLGVQIKCDIPVTMSSFFPAAAKPGTQPGFEIDNSLPTASRYILTLKFYQQQQILPHQLMEEKLLAHQLQPVDRKESTLESSFRFENKDQLQRAITVLRTETYNGTPITTLGMITSSINSAYSVRTTPIPRSYFKDWVDPEGDIIFGKALADLHAKNPLWFPSDDVESVSYYRCDRIPRGFKASDGPFATVKLFISQAAYRHFLRTDRSMTKVVFPTKMVQVYEDVDVILCWDCCSYGHRSGSCQVFRCRYCLSNHANNVNCPQKESPQCRNCHENNVILDNPNLTPKFANWKRLDNIGHQATSGVCKTMHFVKDMHLARLKSAALNRLPLPPFTFP